MTIPVVDLADFLSGDPARKQKFVNELGKAYEEVGFVAVKNHGIPDDLIADLYKNVQQFFALPDEVKLSYEKKELAGQRGYTSFGREHAKGYEAPDLKEFFQYGQEVEDNDPIKKEYPGNVTVNEVPAFTPTLKNAYRNFEKSGKALLQAIALYLGLDEHYRNGHKLIILLRETGSKIQMKLFTYITANLQGFILFSTLALLGGCTPRYAAYVSHYQVPAAGSLPNYNDLYYWAAHPDKNDPSDSIPAGIADRSRDTLADVFFIHPTTYTRSREDWNADLHNAALNAKTDYTSILYQASVFNQHARVFAPRYRQAHISAFFVDSSESVPVFEQAYEDIKRSFQHYLQQYNHGRPIIIAGHSQGALMAEQLLREFFDGKPLQSQLVAAYVIGWPVPQNYFKELRVCTTPQQAGCFCSWRTFHEGYRPEYVEKETPPALVTNPLSWSTDETYVGREANKGSVLRDFNQVVPNTTDARIYGGVLWSKKPKFPGSALFVTRNYHVGDINLFYMNLRENVEQRIYMFLKRQFPD